MECVLFEATQIEYYTQGIRDYTYRITHQFLYAHAHAQAPAKKINKK